jgi:putative FmdB family regulatory protein
MPVYQYLCPKCNLKFELKQSFSDDSMVVCPKCQNGARRLFSSVPIIFKGPGFYVTDNRKNAAESTSNVTERTSKEDQKADKSEHKEAEKPS